jgi:hypothetical protein
LVVRKATKHFTHDKLVSFNIKNTLTHGRGSALHVGQNLYLVESHGASPSVGLEGEAADGRGRGSRFATDHDDDLPLREELVSILPDLVSSGDDRGSDLLLVSLEQVGKYVEVFFADYPSADLGDVDE